MMRMRWMKYFMAVSAMVAASSCVHEEAAGPEGPAGTVVTFTASIGGDQTRTSMGMNEEGKPQSVWNDGDRIVIHNGTKGFEFGTSLEESSSKADFTYVGDDFSMEDDVMAVYPSGDWDIDPASRSAVVSIPAMQQAVAGSYDSESAVAAAYSDDRSLQFMNITAMLKFTVADEGVRSIVFSSLKGEPVSGDVLVVMSEDGASVETISASEDSSHEVTLTADGGFKSGETYYMAALPQTLEGGFSVYFQFSEGGTRYEAKLYEKACTLKRNVILNIGELSCALPELTDATPVLNSMKFEVGKNQGKILAREFSHSIKSSFLSSSYELSETKVTEKKCTIDQTARTVSLYVPYLNSRRLVPTFDIPDGTVLLCGDKVVENGVTEVDFTGDVRLKVVNGLDESVEYTVRFTNTGLPVVVINQDTGTTSEEADSKYSKGSAAWYKATGTKWQPKESDWLMTDGKDDFMIYNADGTSALTDKNGATVSEPVLASTRVRGNVTQQMPKKPFAVKLDKKHGINISNSDGTEVKMPAHKRWVLLANWKDRTLMRNAVAFGIAEVFKNTLSGGMAWNPSGQFVELVYNGVHVGNYYLCEQVKIDGNRLDINEPFDVEDNPYTDDATIFGYLLESDDGYDEAWKFTTANYIPFLLKDDANADMLTYVQDFVRGIEDQLYEGSYSAAYEKMDLASFVDFLLIQELMMNSELAHPKSCYSYVNDGKMYAGPLWDFDWNTLPTSTSYSEDGYSYTASMLTKSSSSHSSGSYPDEPKVESDKNYIWYPMLVKDSEFTSLAARRWDAVKLYVQNYVNDVIPEIQKSIALSESVNSAMWPVDTKGGIFGMGLRYSTFGIGGGYCGDEGMDFSTAVSTLQSTLSTRIAGMSYVSEEDWP